MKNNPLVYSLALTTAFLWNGGELFAQRTTENASPRILKSQKKGQIAPTQFLKLVNDSSGNPRSLQTSITRYQSNDLLVDLIAVIHIGEKQYYKKLDHQFSQYQSLLYELVAPENHRVPTQAERANSSSNPLRMIQGTMQNMLGLHSQLEHIDYSKKNFVHADLSPTQIKRKLEDRGETPWTFAFKAFGELMQNQNSPAAESLSQDIQSFDQLFSMMSDSTKLKRMLAKQFTAGGAMEMGLGKSLNQLLIDDRNEAAMRVLREEVRDGKTRLALFYGAAHMPDFEKRLTSELGLRKTRQAWVEAWDLKRSTNSRAKDPVNSIADMLFQLLDEASK